MKIATYIGTFAGVVVLVITIALIANTNPRSEIRDDFGVFTRGSQQDEHVIDSHVGDFGGLATPTNDTLPEWFDQRKTSEGATPYKEDTPRTQSDTQDSTNVASDHVSTQPESSIDTFVTNFWGERNTDTVEIATQDAQQALLKNYGNAIGKIIKDTVSNKLASQNDTLMAFTKDTSRKESVLAMQDVYETLGQKIATIKAPDGFAEAQKRLSDGYTTVGKGLGILSQAQEGTLYSTMLVYNEHVERFASAFVSYALLFGAHGVMFTQDEPGGIFTPPVGGI